MAGRAPQNRQSGYPRQEGGYPRQEGGYPRQEGGYPQQLGLDSPGMVISSQPITTQPTTSQPITSQPKTSQPITSQPKTSQPITSQPKTKQPVEYGNIPRSAWMAKPLRVVNCPPGLEYLTVLDRVYIKQELELLEIVTGWETQNRYFVNNSDNEKIYFVIEVSSFATRQCCGPLRACELYLYDHAAIDIFHLDRALAVFQYMKVTLSSDILLGTVEEDFTLVYPYFQVKNANGESILTIIGPLFTEPVACEDIHFEMFLTNGNIPVGTITRHYPEAARHYFTDADNFEITFPMELDVAIKATLIGACLLIDFAFYER